MAERTILLTGATDGLGRAVAEVLAAEGARVLVHGRDAGRLARTAAEIEKATGNGVESVRADLASLDEVRALAEDVRRRTERLDVLVNNAGIGFGEPDGHDRRTSRDGYELRFAVNYLAGFLLTLELLPLLRASAPARVVNVASLSQHPLDFADLMLERGYDGWRAYSQSKLAQVMFTVELARRLPAAEVTVNSLHPATYMPTKMVLEERGSVDTLETGVRSVVRLVSDPALDGVTGRFYDRTRESRVDDQAYDPAAREELWSRSLDLTNAPDAI